jgi:hypothetical protein
MKWQEIVKTVAPMLGAALGGPMAGAAIKVLSGQILGDENAGVEALESAILSASPDQLVEIKKLDYQFKIDMLKIGVDVFALEVQERSNARENHKDNITPAVLVYMLTAMVFIGGYAIFMTEIPEANETLANLVFGALLAKWGDSIAYWVGTTKGSADKNRLIPGTTKP